MSILNWHWTVIAGVLGCGSSMCVDREVSTFGRFWEVSTFGRCGVTSFLGLGWVVSEFGLCGIAPSPVFSTVELVLSRPAPGFILDPTFSDIVRLLEVLVLMWG